MLFSKYLQFGILVSSVVVADDTIGKSLQAITAKVLGLNTTLTNFKGDLPGLFPLLIDSNALLNTIKDGKKISDKAPVLTFQETLLLAEITTVLVKDTNDTITTLIATKPKLAPFIIAVPIVLSTAKSLRNATVDLSTSVIAKIPRDIQPVAQQLIQLIDDQFARAIKAYS